MLQKYTLTHGLTIPLQTESLTTAICYKFTSFCFRGWSIWNTVLRGQTVSTNISVNNLHSLILFQISQLHLPCIRPIRSTAHIPYIYFPATPYTSAPTKQSFPTAASQSPCTLSHPVNIPIFQPLPTRLLPPNSPSQPPLHKAPVRSLILSTFPFSPSNVFLQFQPVCCCCMEGQVIQPCCLSNWGMLLLIGVVRKY